MVLAAPSVQPRTIEVHDGRTENHRRLPSSPVRNFQPGATLVGPALYHIHRRGDVPYSDSGVPLHASARRHLAASRRAIPPFSPPNARTHSSLGEHLWFVSGK